MLRQYIQVAQRTKIPGSTTAVCRAPPGLSAAYPPWQLAVAGAKYATANALKAVKPCAKPRRAGKAPLILVGKERNAKGLDLRKLEIKI
ncbi:hypothetical protein NPIL_478111 [Nephila pilipes]|uniref:Uncharacterized protein n=1 Tax=Nephila pilipes TaxID=299642 RepID=A0A8X6U348_NEPPI|nr:hypothetical protein NPIL_478111 [Nephila pilipes]